MTARPDTAVGANAGRSRSHNRQVVLGRVRAAGRSGRAEIARATGLTTQAVSNIIAELAGEGLIAPQGRRAGGRGMPAMQYALNPEGGYALGIEIRPDAVFAAVLDLTGQPVFESRRPLDRPDRRGVTRTVLALRDAALREVSGARARLLGAGLVMPGPFGDTGIAGSGSDLAGWADTDPRAWFAEALGLAVEVENDANAAAMAERVAGAGQGLESFVFVYFGQGLGLGIVHRGRLVAGAFGNAGEIGHIPVPAAGRTVPLETAVSRLSVRRALAAAGREADSAADLARLYAARDPALMAWLAAAAEPFSAAITIVENLFDPETVILGGAMPEPIVDHLIASAVPAERSVSNRAGRGRPRLVRGACGPMTATLGAAALILDRTFTPAIAVAR
ncbi:ROK family transcriptional regulator [Rhodobacteraceae bacterium CCMM004]|nr:ROK family transcriptional regulator [Rhodobacteraceae bacterium CCMM004]